VRAKVLEQTFHVKAPSMVKQEDDHAHRNKKEYKNHDGYDVTPPKFSVRVEIANGVPDFFI
jgi:hypothetical protein